MSDGSDGFQVTKKAENRGNTRLRLFDRWFGVPLVALLGGLRTQRVRPPEVRSIGFLLLGAIGDTLLASAVIAALRREFPPADFTWIVDEGNQALARLIAGRDQVLVIPLKKPWRALSLIRAHTFDIVIDFGPWPRISAVFAALARARFTIGFRTPGQARHFAYDAAVPHSGARHEMDNFHALSAPLIGRPTQGRPSLASKAQSHSLPPGKSWLIFHPWPAGFQHHWRNWPEENWLSLANIVSGWGYGIVLTGGPADRANAQALAGKMGPAAISRAGTTLGETIRLLAEADAVIAVNTGVMHIAAALDRPMVALHGPTDPKRWGPLSDMAVTVGPGQDKGCAYLNLGFEYPAQPPDCMGMITVNEVVDALRKLIRPPAAAE